MKLFTFAIFVLSGLALLLAVAELWFKRRK